MQRLTFEQHLLLMEALSRLTSKVRDRVADGETYLQDTLTTLEALENSIDAGTVYVEQLEQILLHGNSIDANHNKIGEAA